MPTTIELLPRGMRAGLHRDAERAVPLAVTGLRLEVDRDALPDTPVELLRCEIALSLDGGLTWPFGWHFAAAGGVARDKQGNIIATSAMRIRLPGVGNTQRRIRVSLDARQAIDTGLRLTVYP